MRRYVCIPMVLGLLPSSVMMADDGKDAQRPNIIVFLVDDMGWVDTSYPFGETRSQYNDVFRTPNMERLACEGMAFTQAYAAAISSPSRCSLMTGMNAARHRVTNWTLKKDWQPDRESPVVDLPSWNYNGISPVEGVNNTFVSKPFVQILKDGGYHTIHCGKAHFGATDTPGADPLNMGFVVNIAGHAGGGIATYLSERNYGHDDKGVPFSPQAIPGLEKYWQSGIFATEALTREALRALDDAHKKDKPFYLYMSHYAVHAPVDKDMRFYPSYIAKGYTEKEAAYASLVEGMDKSLGDILDWLDRNDEAKNTIVIFMSDNGGLTALSRWRDGELHTQNAPLRSGKGSLYEGGIREPMIVRWPGTVRPSSRCDKYLMIEDFYPTILEMAEIGEYSTKNDIDGISFVPMLRENGDTSQDRALIWNYPNVWDVDGPGINLNCSIRKGDWKLIYYYDSGKKELYNIREDIGECHDLSSSNGKLVRELSVELGQRLRACDAQRPTFKKDGKPCPWPDEI